MAEQAQNRLADRITAFVGSMAFVYFHVLWFGFWIGFGVEDYLRPTDDDRLAGGDLSRHLRDDQPEPGRRRRQVIADEAWRTVQKEDRQNEELLALSKQTLALTREVHSRSSGDRLGDAGSAGPPGGAAPIW